VRETLLELTVAFVHTARNCPGVARIALIGSIVTPKPWPKDVDLLVSVAPKVDMSRLAKAGRRLKGSAQAKLNSGADVFLADTTGRYLGRVCHYRECHSRVLCRALHCGAVPHLNDDLDAVCIAEDIIATPPVELWPNAVARVPLPGDVKQLLLAPLRRESTPA
jgi:hypothetical protein